MRFVLPIFFLLVCLAAPARAQSGAVGASYTFLSLTYPDQIPNGFGGWATWRFIDLTANLFPEDHPIVGRQVQLLGGVRGGFRGERVGAYLRLRPGLVHFTERFYAPDTVCILIFPPPESCLIEGTNAAVDVGGTAEITPPGRLVIRVDVGDTLIRFGREGRDAVWKHNLQLAAGAGVRF